MCPTLSRSLCLPPARTQRCAVVTRGAGGVSLPRKHALNGTMPAAVKSSVGSLAGTTGDDGKCRWSCWSRKKLKYDERRSAVLRHSGSASEARWDRARGGAAAVEKDAAAGAAGAAGAVAVEEAALVFVALVELLGRDRGSLQLRGRRRAYIAQRSVARHGNARRTVCVTLCAGADKITRSSR